MLVLRVQVVRLSEPAACLCGTVTPSLLDFYTKDYRISIVSQDKIISYEI